jgi:hypothetical protein
VRIAFVGNFGVDYSSETHHAKTLQSMGHEVVQLQEGSASGERILEESLRSDLLVFIHTHGWSTPRMPLERVLTRLNRERIPTVTYHLDLWKGLQRQRDLDRDPFYRLIGWFFTPDKLMADWFCENTAVKGRFLPAGVFDQECYIAEDLSKHPHGNEVIFVGSRGYHPEHPWRPTLIDWLRNTYGSRFTHVGPDGDTGTIRGHDLNRVYASSKVAVGDTLCLNFTYPFYASDRLFEAPGRGAFQLFPRITGLDEWFTDGETIRFFGYGDFDGLKDSIDFYLDNEVERERIRLAGHEHVKANHTYIRRWQSILDTVFA